MKLIHKYLDERKLVRGTYTLLLILVATTIIDFIDDAQVGTRGINIMTLTWPPVTLKNFRFIHQPIFFLT